MALEIAQAKERTEAIKANRDAAYMALLAEVHLAESRQRAADVGRATARALEDLAVRLMAARGATDDEMDAMREMIAQQREYEDAVRAGKDAVYLATLAEVHRAETIAREMAKVERTIGELSNTIEGLQAFRNGLLLGSSSTLSPMQKLDEARRQYEQVVAAAKAGDQAAAGRLPGAAQSFLDASKAVNASGPGYASDFAEVMRTTDQITKMFENQRSVEQLILSVLKDEQTDGKRFHDDVVHRFDRSLDEQVNHGRILVAGFEMMAERLAALESSVEVGATVTRKGFEGLKLVSNG